MHRNIARAYDYLKREHDRIRAAHVRILPQNDRALERALAATPKVTDKFYFWIGIGKLESIV